MYRTAFPRCTVLGSFEPVPYSHFLNGAVPAKCSQCDHLFEGSCLRAKDQVRDYLSLDHGPCPVTGPTDPVLIETKYYVSKVSVPSKCRDCRYLLLDHVRGFVCNFESEKWGYFPRTLDWGLWTPEYPNLGLQSGRSVSVDVMRAVQQRNEVAAVKAFRAVHKDASFKEARDAYAELVEKVHGAIG